MKRVNVSSVINLDVKNVQIQIIVLNVIMDNNWMIKGHAKIVLISSLIVEYAMGNIVKNVTMNIILVMIINVINVKYPIVYYASK